MCGIVGMVCFGGVLADPQLISKATSALAHRGPDAEGVYQRDQVCFGHRRLQIVGGPDGKQPWVAGDGQIAITYNGELYNAGELRARLLALGLPSRGRSDTEVVALAWAAWKEQCLLHLRGMFAFAIADFRDRRIFLARDPFGIKPLYYSVNGHALSFASELQALRILDPRSGSIDPRSLDQYLLLGCIPAPRTVYRDLRKLEHAHFMSFPLDGPVGPPRRYWAMRFDPRPAGSVEDWTDEVEATLTESVRVHMVADTPCGALLSGGIDSSLVVSLMARESVEPVETFSIAFADDRYNELPWAKAVSARWGTKSNVRLVDSSSVEALARLMAHHGEPFADASSLPTYQLAALAREHVPMVVSGDGGDELFAGYPSYPRWLDALEVERPVNHEDRLDLWQRCMLGQVMDLKTRRSLWRRDYWPEVGQPIEALDQAMREAAGFDPLGQARYIDLQTYLPNWILAKQDIASMAHGLEVRTPFIDLAVAGVCARMPSDLALQRNAGSGGAPIGKYILKQILGKHFPEAFVHRRKQGFVPPAEAWLRSEPGFMKWVRRLLLHPDAHLHNWFEPAAIDALLGLELRDNWQKIWALICLEVWLSG